MKGIKKITTIFICIISLLLFYSFSFAGPCDSNTKEPNEDEVVFFEHINYGGCWMAAKVVANYASLVGNAYMPICGKTINWNDTISSIKVGAKAKVTVYEHVNYGGKSQTWKGNCNAPFCLKDLRDWGWNDKISSFRVDKNYDCY